MVDSNNMDALAWLRKQLDGDENDLLREMVREFAQRLGQPREATRCRSGGASPAATRTST